MRNQERAGQQRVGAGARMVPKCHLPSFPVGQVAQCQCQQRARGMHPAVSQLPPAPCGLSGDIPLRERAAAPSAGARGASPGLSSPVSLCHTGLSCCCHPVVAGAAQDSGVCSGVCAPWGTLLPQPCPSSSGASHHLARPLHGPLFPSRNDSFEGQVYIPADKLIQLPSSH